MSGSRVAKCQKLNMDQVNQQGLPKAQPTQALSTLTEVTTFTRSTTFLQTQIHLIFGGEAQFLEPVVHSKLMSIPNTHNAMES